MSGNAQYELLTLSGHENSQKLSSNLMKKLNEPASGKRITLNERFTIVERKYCLQSIKKIENPNETPVYFRVHERHLISKTDFIENYLAHNPIKSTESSPSKTSDDDKENAQKSGEIAEKPAKRFSMDAYIRDVSMDILKA